MLISHVICLKISRRASRAGIGGPYEAPPKILMTPFIRNYFSPRARVCVCVFLMKPLLDFSVCVVFTCVLGDFFPGALRAPGSQVLMKLLLKSL